VRNRRRSEYPAGRFEAYLGLKLGELERTAAVTAAEIQAEARDLRADTGLQPLAADDVDAIAQRARRAVERIAEELSDMRRQLTAAGRNGNGEAAPSEGVEMFVRQMAIAGADASEIERELAHLGMEHPRSAIESVLAEPH
jgi:propanediol dehydratase large subunit